MTCLIWASMNGHVEVVRAVLDARANLNAQDKVMGGARGIRCQIGALVRIMNGWSGAGGACMVNGFVRMMELIVFWPIVWYIAGRKHGPHQG